MAMRALVPLVLCTVGACREPIEHEPFPDAAPDGLRVATFNVRRFFDTVCDSGACTADDYEALPSESGFAQRALEIANAVRALEADVVALEEIETQACLDAILANLGDALPYGVLGETDTAASVDVAILSRAPFDAVLRHRADNPLTLPTGGVTTFSRELLEAHARIDGVDVIMFAAHFKAKVNDEPARRLAEAEASRRIVNDAATQAPDSLVILGGDLNDTPDSPPLAALTDDGGLIRVADDLPVDAQATYLFGGRGQAIDHLLLAPNTASSRRIPHSSRAWRGSGSSGWGGSDHFALTSDFAINAE